MTPATSTLSALLTAVARDPLDDVLRLAVADRLDELGEHDAALSHRLDIHRRAMLSDLSADGPRLAYAGVLEDYATVTECPMCKGVKVVREWGADSGYKQCPNCDGNGTISPERMRAEFIRASCRVQRADGRIRGDLHLELRLMAHDLNSAAHLWADYIYKSGLMLGRMWSKVVKYNRGFPSSLTCSWADWLEHAPALYWRPAKCRKCNSIGCDSCRGIGRTGRIPRACPETALPIERVRLTTWPDAEWIGSRMHVEPLVAEWPGIEFEMLGE